MDLADRVREALGDRYLLDREVGHGGMATVYLAHDLRHDRNVAIKVLRPELALAIGTERFLNEIRVAANLTHPNILPLHDSGEAGDLLYYVMPYIEGESLAERLIRDGPLPLEDALRITKQLARALHYAHGQGVVHRDIKPANVMISGNEVMLSDFGISRAVDSAHSEKLTGTGMVLGTPAYMSPEQVMGAEDIDGRSDIYSLACMLYEMLTGGPPFAAPSPQALMARQAVDLVTPLRKVVEVPRSVEAAVDRALAKEPADRFDDALEFATALDEHPTISGTLQSFRRRRLTRRAVVSAMVLAAAAGAVYAWGWFSGRDTGDPGLDSASVAVMPFRVGGTIAPGQGDLAGGIPQLLYERLPGDVGPRAVFPSAIASALRERGWPESEPPSPEDAADVARDLGAGQVLLGQVMGAGSNVNLSATLYDASTGGELVRADDVSGSADSLLVLVDQLTAKLLSRQAGVADQRLPNLMSTRLPAVRAYLAGQTELSARRLESAARLFNEALDQDSTFALAALALLMVRDWAPGPTWSRAIDVALANRDRLSQRDDLVLTAVLGPRYPANATAAEYLAAWEAVVYAIPDQADAWYELGAQRFESGALVGMADPLGSARAAFARALEIEPRHVAALGRLIDIATLTGDSAAIREYEERYLALEDPSSRADFLDWRLAILRNDTAAVRRMRERFPELPNETLRLILGRAQLDGVGLADARRAADALLRRAGSRGEIEDAHIGMRALLLNQGRPSEAAQLPWPEAGRYERAWSRLHQTVFAVYWDADSRTADGLAASDPSYLDTLAIEPRASSHHYFEVCAMGLAKSAAGDFASIDRMLRHLRAFPEPLDLIDTAYIEVCAAMLEAERAVRLGRPGARATVTYLDSLMSRGIEVYGMMSAAGNLAAARLNEELGDLEAALEASRRRRFLTGRGVQLLSTMLREEGRLAELSGDIEGAVAAYSHYLALRSDPEDALVADVEAVRDALTGLQEVGPTSSAAVPTG